MYQELHRWDECIAVAEAKVLFLSSVKNLASPVSEVFRWEETIRFGMGLGLADRVRD